MNTIVACIENTVYTIQYIENLIFFWAIWHEYNIIANLDYDNLIISNGISYLFAVCMVETKISQ